MQHLLNTLPPSLNRLINLIKADLDAGGKLSPLRAKELVLQADVQVEDLEGYADYDHPREDCYGRQLVCENPSFEVMVMSWNPGDYSSIHNHGYTQWGVVQVFGNAHHCIYHLKDKELRFSKKEFLEPGDAIKVNNALIHQMGNPSSGERFLTLHVYGSNELDENITADAKNFDLEFNRVSHTTGGAFFNLSEDQIYDFEEGITATEEVFMHYARLLMKYYNRQEPTEKIRNLKRALLEKMEENTLV